MNHIVAPVSRSVSYLEVPRIVAPLFTCCNGDLESGDLPSLCTGNPVIDNKNHTSSLLMCADIQHHQQGLPRTVWEANLSSSGNNRVLYRHFYFTHIYGCCSTCVSITALIQVYFQEKRISNRSVDKSTWPSNYTKVVILQTNVRFISLHMLLFCYCRSCCREEEKG